MLVLQPAAKASTVGPALDWAGRGEGQPGTAPRPTADRRPVPAAGQTFVPNPSMLAAFPNSLVHFKAGIFYGLAKRGCTSDCLGKTELAATGWATTRRTLEGSF